MTWSWRWGARSSIVVLSLLCLGAAPASEERALIWDGGRAPVGVAVPRLAAEGEVEPAPSTDLEEPSGPGPLSDELSPGDDPVADEEVEPDPDEGVPGIDEDVDEDVDE